jgi:four helix bundle protein
MKNIKSFEDLEVWKISKEFTLDIYKITGKKEFNHDYSLRDQLRRASVSIISNIAEGYERNGNKEMVQFLIISKGSAGEIRAQLIIAFELNYLSQSEFEELKDKIFNISKQLSGFIKYIKQSELKGSKYSIM